MVEESYDANLGPVYSIHSMKPGVTNSDVAYKLYYIGETAKWSASRRKAIEKASNRTTTREAVAKTESSESE